MKLSFLFFLISALVLSVSACTPSQTTTDDHSHADGVEDDHSHEENVPDDHGHEEGTPDEHSHDAQGSTVIGDQETKIDHHGNPVFDEEERVYEQVIEEGVSVEFTIENFLGVGGRGGELAPRILEGENAVLQFHITDSVTGAPLAGLQPAVWLDIKDGDIGEKVCRSRVEGYLGGTLNARPMVDLNSYFILGMNKDNTISVIDPMVDVAGMTNLFAVILLQGVPQDWALTADHLNLVVTMPELSKVAIVDLDSFQVESNIDVRGTPRRVIIQPDGRYAWVEIESQNNRESGVAVIDVVTQSLVSQISTGEGIHNLSFSLDGNLAFIINSGAGSLTIVDTSSLDIVKELYVGKSPASIGVSAVSGHIYVTDKESGSILIVDSEQFEEIGRMIAEPGLDAVGISPDGKWGFAINPDRQQVFVFEADKNRITHSVPLKGVPDQIFFTKTAAYLRSTSSPAIFVIPFEEINPTGNISLLTVPMGDLPPNLVDSSLTASAISVTPDQSALLISNPADDKIYYYIEGSQSPTGGYQGHTLIPRAVNVVDRSLKERSPGVYTGGIRIPKSGDFMVAFYLNDPQIVHCFQFTAKPNLELNGSLDAFQPELTFLTEEQPVAGEQFILRVSLKDMETGKPVEGLPDLFGLVRVLAGNWNQRVIGKDLGNGVYEFQITFPQAGSYNLFFTVPSLNIGFDILPQRTIQVLAK